MGFASQFPVFLASPLGGIVADRYNRHRVVIATQTASMVLAFILAALTLTHHITVPEIFVLAILLGIVNAFDLPGRQSFLVEMVGKDDLMNAIALNSSMFNGARVVGPGDRGDSGGKDRRRLVLFRQCRELHRGDCRAAADATSSPRAIRPYGLGDRPRHRRISIRATDCAHSRSAVLVGLVSLVAMPYTVLMPIFADKILHGGGLKLCRVDRLARSGRGAAGHPDGRDRSRRSPGRDHARSPNGVHGLGRWITLACAGFGVSLIAFALSHIFWLSAALLVPAGFCMMLQMSSSNTLIQSMVPDDLRGRVMSVYAMSLIGMAPFGALFAGAVADRLGAPVTVIMGAVACLGGAAIFGLHLPKIRDEARRLIGAQQMVGGEPATQVTVSVED